MHQRVMVNNNLWAGLGQSNTNQLKGGRSGSFFGGYRGRLFDRGGGDPFRLDHHHRPLPLFPLAGGEDGKVIRPPESFQRADEIAFPSSFCWQT